MGSKQRTTAAFLLALGLAGCGRGGTERAKAQPPLVKVATPATHRFVDRIEAVGTARANEQVTLASPVTERIERLHFDDGGYVARGQVIAVLAQGQEQASLAGALAAERQAKAQLGRIESLTGRGFVTRASLEQQTAAAQQARATADDARAQISDRVIRAPFGGYVSLRTISEGAIVGAGTVIATVSDVSRIKLDFSVPETMLASLRKGQALDATAAAFPGRAFHGVVATIDPVIDPTTRAVLVRALLPNPDRALKPGMLLTVRVDAATREAASLPELAIVGEGSERYVYVVGKDNKAARAAVTTGLRDNGLVEVRGLPADAKVIVEGVVKVSDGARVRVQGARAPANGRLTR